MVWSRGERGDGRIVSADADDFSAVCSDGRCHCCGLVCQLARIRMRAPLCWGRGMLLCRAGNQLIGLRRSDETPRVGFVPVSLEGVTWKVYAIYLWRAAMQ